MDSSAKADWIAVDWGTSNLRAWAMSDAGEVLNHATSEDGMGSLAQSEFEPALLRLVEPWLDGPTTVVACGMVGSRQGWKEAEYRAVPCRPTGQNTTRVGTNDPRLNVHLISGIKQEKPADVMRGEETQIAGLLAANPNFDGVVCLPGTHSKWVRISAEECVSFQTYMTGELFAILANNSVLRHTVESDGWDDAAFIAAVDDALSKPEILAARLFSLRAETLLHDLTAASARARLSGLLIGIELAASRPYWLGQDIVIIGAERISAHYATALKQQGCTPTTPAAQNLTLAGLSATYLSLKETSK
ncbi:2-dehydro-3-deoxygalactonokinase [Falsihalocynthiibacter sp. SS001]|uniref:2-dehydro-3-deoxygalactonokinase n=1 Tax=Falsihalocynthiibacter sp. SS001 TaxID=3349698 RepID=UPI0036D3D715